MFLPSGFPEPFRVFKSTFQKTAMPLLPSSSRFPAIFQAPKRLVEPNKLTGSHALRLLLACVPSLARSEGPWRSAPEELDEAPAWPG